MPSGLAQRDHAHPNTRLVAVLLAPLLAGVCLVGMLWGASTLPTTSRQMFGTVWVADVARALGYGLALLVPAGLAAHRLRGAGQRLWRGVALALAVGGGHALLAGMVLDGSGRPKPDLVAPGLGIISSLPDARYAEFHGTSMAASHLAGVVALVWSANPALIGDITRTRLILTSSARRPPGPIADPCGPPQAVGPAGAGRDNLYGYGEVDALAAVQAALALK